MIKDFTGSRLKAGFLFLSQITRKGIADCADGIRDFTDREKGYGDAYLFSLRIVGGFKSIS
jgi:hypothetical protein